MSLPICTICLDDLEGSNDVSILSCGHLYHYPCIQKWSVQCSHQRQPAACPSCKKKIEWFPARGTVFKVYFDYGGERGDKSKEVLDLEAGLAHHAELVESQEVQIANLEKKVLGLERQLAYQNELVSSQEVKIANLQEEVANANKKVSDLRSEVEYETAAQTKLVESYEVQISDLNKKIENRSKQSCQSKLVASHESQISSFMKQVEARNGEVLDLEELLVHQTKRVTSHEVEILSLKEQVANNVMKVSALEAQLTFQMEEVVYQEAKLAILKKQVSNPKPNLSDIDYGAEPSGVPSQRELGDVKRNLPSPLRSKASTGPDLPLPALEVPKSPPKKETKKKLKIIAIDNATGIITTADGWKLRAKMIKVKTEDGGERVVKKYVKVDDLGLQQLMPSEQRSLKRSAPPTQSNDLPAASVCSDRTR